MGPMILRGTVTKVGAMQKTATVTVWRWVVHRKTQKRIELSKKYLTHDPENKLHLEDEVEIINCRPISARKRFTLHNVIRSTVLEREARHEQLEREKASLAKASGNDGSSQSSRILKDALSGWQKEETPRPAETTS
ncbi:nucleic acid-binding protein [Sistotremastrum suecicum HHB10207 ss-3]|uniref:Nucleic acid-binding protein n=1 Tax=Sistotremastrum suecicum HHB10207 ss-3 TaxID=1314776 RepID=A0A166F8E9_9AGAM|nr:nucleic acid-binding protein [Sistotremastrum suecicum HHB10207 ss-3]